MKQTELFASLSRQKFRDYFQPTRVVLGIVPAPTSSGVNIITLCYHMYCSDDPVMMAFAIREGSCTYDLIRQTDECVLAVPGERLAKETMFCGTTSAQKDGKIVLDKASECKFTLLPSHTITVPGILECIANIELAIAELAEIGDYVTVLGHVKRFGVNRGNRERPLLSVGSNYFGYDVLARKDIHRIAVVSQIKPI